jgi:hypothetical protein
VDLGPFWFSFAFPLALAKPPKPSEKSPFQTAGTAVLLETRQPVKAVLVQRMLVRRTLVAALVQRTLVAVGMI